MMPIHIELATRIKFVQCGVVWTLCKCSWMHVCSFVWCGVVLVGLVNENKTDITGYLCVIVTLFIRFLMRCVFFLNSTKKGKRYIYCPFYIKRIVSKCWGKNGIIYYFARGLESGKRSVYFPLFHLSQVVYAPLCFCTCMVYYIYVIMLHSFFSFSKVRFIWQGITKQIFAPPQTDIITAALPTITTKDWGIQNDLSTRINIWIVRPFSLFRCCYFLRCLHRGLVHRPNSLSVGC